MTLWMLARATGFVALAAFTISIVLGASSSERTRPARSDRALDRRVLLQLAHRSAGLVGVTMLGAHAALIVADS